MKRLVTVPQVKAASSILKPAVCQASVTHGRSLSPKSTIHHTNKRGIFGPTEWTWKPFEQDFESPWLVDHPDHDPRMLSMDEIRTKFGIGQLQVLPHIPELELPDNSWYSTNHLMVQQTHLDDVWRMGFSPVRFTHTRHVEWLVFDCVPNQKLLYSEAVMWYSISDWKPLGWICPQSLTDIQFTLQSPWHRIEVVSTNERIQENPALMISSTEKVEWKWIIVLRWVNDSCSIFDRKPIIDGRYGEWYDRDQYLEWVKDSGEYKKWQWDEVDKMHEEGRLNWKADFYGAPDPLRKQLDDKKVQAKKALGQNPTPRFQELDDRYQRGSKKPKWLPW